MPSLLKMTGFIFEVDVKYAVKLHDYPIAPESFQIKPELLSAYQTELLARLEIKEDTCTKLVYNLVDKKKYVVHYRNLQLYQALGLRLAKVHRILSLKQNYWLKAYTNFDKSTRQKASNNF